MQYQDESPLRIEEIAWHEHQAAVLPLQASLRADPAEFEANLYLATTRLEQNDDRTEPLLDLALQIHLGDLLARLDQAKIFALTGSVEDAISSLRS